MSLFTPPQDLSGIEMFSIKMDQSGPPPPESDKSNALNIREDSTQTLQKIYTYEEVEDLLSSTYDTRETNNSTICDIIAIYLKGQKILYTEAKTICEQRLTFLMLPAIFLTVLCSIVILLLKDYEYGTLITSTLNGLIAFILAVVNYLKLDARAEAHRTSAYKFDKLQSYVEFNSGKMLFIVGESRNLGKIILDTENNVREIKETNQFVLPEKVRYNFPNLCGINIFAEVKRRQHKEMRMINDLTIVMNKISYLQTEFLLTGKGDDDEIKRLLDKQVELHSIFVQMKDELLNIDEEFEKEMKKYRERSKYRIQLFNCLKV